MKGTFPSRGQKQDPKQNGSGLFASKVDFSCLSGPFSGMKNLELHAARLVMTLEQHTILFLALYVPVFHEWLILS